MKLYIIGNGFDQAHHLQTSYQDFCRFMQTHHEEDYRRIGQLFFDDESVLWSDFENNLAHLNIERLVNERVGEWVHLQGYQIENDFDTEFSNLKAYFMEWVTSQFNDIAAEKIYDLSPSDFYITFNYTNTLHVVYGIPNTHLLYIHENSVEKHYLMPVVGHGESNDAITVRVENYRDYIRNQVEYALHNEAGVYPVEETVEVICHEIVTFLDSLRKDVDEVMLNHDDFFEELATHKNHIGEVVILGHSLAEVDAPYFRKIGNTLDVDTVWSVNYYPNSEEAKQQKLQRFYEMMGFQAEAFELR